MKHWYLPLLPFLMLFQTGCFTQSALIEAPEADIVLSTDGMRALQRVRRERPLVEVREFVLFGNYQGHVGIDRFRYVVQSDVDDAVILSGYRFVDFIITGMTFGLGVQSDTVKLYGQVK